MRLTYVGHASFLVEARDGRSILLDPCRPNALGGRIRTATVERNVDVVAITHFHEDHGWLGAVPGEPVVVDQSRTSHHIRFRTHTSAHDGQDGARMGLSRSIRFRVDEVTVLHTGDLGDFDARWLRQHRGVDLLLLPVGGVYTLPVERAAALLEALEPKWCIPMHYASPTVTLPMGTRDAFVDRLPVRTHVIAAANPTDFDSAPPRGVLLMDSLPADAFVR